MKQKNISINIISLWTILIILIISIYLYSSGIGKNFKIINNKLEDVPQRICHNEMESKKIILQGKDSECARELVDSDSHVICDSKVLITYEEQVEGSALNNAKLYNVGFATSELFYCGNKTITCIVSKIKKVCEIK